MGADISSMGTADSKLGFVWIKDCYFSALTPKGIVINKMAQQKHFVPLERSGKDIHDMCCLQREQQ